MKLQRRLCLFAVPNRKNPSSGPAVRILNMSNAFKKILKSEVIKGNFFSKLKSSLTIKGIHILYIESSTNRLKFIDYICIIILRLKSTKVISFIRDIYFEVFPENYRGIKGHLRKYLNHISNYYYYRVSDVLAFPTLEMAEVFYEKNGIKKQKKNISLPPGTAIDPFFENPEEISSARLKALKFIYVGGIEYKYAGIKNYINFAEKFREQAEFYLVTQDDNIHHILTAYPESTRQKIQLMKLNKDGIRNLIKDEGITFAYHSRPRNIYDDLTYPIKIFDYISYLLPVITDHHKPMVHLLGDAYPLYCDVTNPDEVENICKKVINTNGYHEILKSLVTIREQNLYEKRAEQIISLSDL